MDRKPPIKPDGFGVWVLLLAFLLLALSRLSAFEPLSHYGFVVALIGLALAHFGRAFAVTLWPALAYLFFAIPLPRLIYVGLSGDMQLLSSTLGVHTLQWLGIPVFQDGNVIDLGGYKLQVAEACSGLRYLFPLMSFGFLMAVMFEDKSWKRVVLFLSTIPLTIAALFAEIGLLKRMGRGNRATQSHFRLDYVGFTKGSLWRSIEGKGGPVHAALLLCFLGAALFLSGIIDNRKELTPPLPSFATFPQELADWHGTPETFSSEALAALQLSDYWSASYRRTEDVQAPIDLYIAYYASQRVGSSIHSPSNCLPGGGWKIEEDGIANVETGQGTIPITRMILRKDGLSLLVYYWFDGRGRVIDDQYGAKWYLLVDSIATHRTDGALVRLTTPLLPGEPMAAADRRMQDFLLAAYPSLRSFIPGK